MTRFQLLQLKDARRQLYGALERISDSSGQPINQSRWRVNPRVIEEWPVSMGRRSLLDCWDTGRSNLIGLDAKIELEVRTTGRLSRSSTTSEGSQFLCWICLVFSSFSALSRGPRRRVWASHCHVQARADTDYATRMVGRSLSIWRWEMRGSGSTRCPRKRSKRVCCMVDSTWVTRMLCEEPRRATLDVSPHAEERDLFMGQRHARGAVFMSPELQDKLKDCSAGRREAREERSLRAPDASAKRGGKKGAGAAAS